MRSSALARFVVNVTIECRLLTLTGARLGNVRTRRRNADEPPAVYIALRSDEIDRAAIYAAEAFPEPAFLARLQAFIAIFLAAASDMLRFFIAANTFL